VSVCECAIGTVTGGSVLSFSSTVDFSDPAAFFGSGFFSSFFTSFDSSPVDSTTISSTGSATFFVLESTSTVVA